MWKCPSTQVVLWMTWLIVKLALIRPVNVRNTVPVVVGSSSGSVPARGIAVMYETPLHFRAEKPYTGCKEGLATKKPARLNIACSQKNT